MTYNNLITTLTELLSSHAMIKTVKNCTPKEWLNRDEQPIYPVCCFSVISGTMDKGRQQTYQVQFFFLDVSGQEAEFETEVISDQVGTAYDIVELLRLPSNAYSIDDSVPFNTISDKYEEYLAGVELTTTITTQSSFDGCDVPIV